LKTPGREADNEETKLYTRADYNNKKKSAAKNNNGNDGDELSAAITQGLGGKANISDVDCCATRLRISVIDGNKVNDNILKSTGAAGVVHKGTGIQVIYGPKVTIIKSNLEDYLATDGVVIEEKTLETAKVLSTDNEIKKQNQMEQETMIYTPISGNVLELSELGDGVFSEEMLGKGFAVDPTEGKVVAPFDCKVETIFDTKHAIGLSSDHVQLLIHIGIDTVQLNGKGFDIKVQEGDNLKKGDVIGYFDIKAIIDSGYRVVTPVIITNTDDFTTFELLKKTSVKAGEKILSVQ
jgi:PTS system D-glucosamine-specific IIC component